MESMLARSSCCRAAIGMESMLSVGRPERASCRWVSSWKSRMVSLRNVDTNLFREPKDFQSKSGSMGHSFF